MTVKIYSIFLTYKNFKHDWVFQPIFEDKDGEYWLGGSNLSPLIFKTRKDATQGLKTVRARTKKDWTTKGRFTIERADITRL